MTMNTDPRIRLRPAGPLQIRGRLPEVWTIVLVGPLPTMFIPVTCQLLQPRPPPPQHPHTQRTTPPRPPPEIMVGLQVLEQHRSEARPVRGHPHHRRAPGIPMSVKAITIPTSVQVGRLVATHGRPHQPQQCLQRPPFHPCGNIGKATEAKSCIMVMVQCPGFLRGIISLILFMPPLPPPGSMPNWATCCLCLVRTRRPPATITPQPRWDLHRQPRIWGACSPVNFNNRNSQCAHHSSTLVKNQVSEV